MFAGRREAEIRDAILGGSVEGNVLGNVTGGVCLARRGRRRAGAEKRHLKGRERCDVVKGIEEGMKECERKTKAKLNSQLRCHAEKKESRGQWRKEETERSR